MIGAGMAVLTAGGVLGGPVGFAAADQAPAGSRTHGDGLARFYQQPITWHSCQLDAKDEEGKALDAAKARCGKVTVPLDYSRPDGRTITVAFARRAATDPTARRGTLMLNGGGPGPSMSTVLPVLQGAPAVAQRYDLVGMDPRLMGRSTPMDCGLPTSLVWRTDDAPVDRRSFDQQAAAMKDLATRCAGNKEVLPHASTRNMARDLNVVRAALGEKRVSYLGVSYGSYLGAVFTQMFPDHTDRVVIDSALDPDTYGPQASRGTAPAEAAALRAWAGWAARHHGQYRLGATTAQVLATVNRILRAATHRPLAVGSHSVDATMLPSILARSIGTGVIEETYATFSATVRVLRDAARGATVTPTPDLEESLAGRSSQEPYAAWFSGSLASRCADRAAPRDPETYWRDIQAHRADEPLFGAFTRKLGPCAFWPADPAEPPTTVNNNVPTLIIGADGDTVTHLPGQLKMHRALTGSRMVILRNAYRHGLYLFEGNACIDSTVNRYLLDGVLPSADTTCTRTAPTHPKTGKS